jgi:hypothetical protein
MYIALVQKTQNIKIEFTEEDFTAWKFSSPGSNHTHEKYAEYLAEVDLYDDANWENIEFGVVGVFYSRD